MPHDQSREAILFLFEEESRASRFEIVRYAHYCLDMYDLFKTSRIVPVIILLFRQAIQSTSLEQFTHDLEHPTAG